MKKLIVLGLALAAFGAALAMPNIYGVCGGFYTQNADIQKGVSLTVTNNVDGDWAKIPLIQLTVGVTPNLELSAGYFNWSDDSNWGASGKYVLPFTIGKGKIAAGATYWRTGHEGVEWDAALSGTWPIFANTTFTGEVVFNRFDSTNTTIFEANLSRTFKNGTVGGLEYVNKTPYALDGFFDIETDNQGVAYVNFPINEMLTGRLALNGIATSEGTNFYASVNAKF